MFLARNTLNPKIKILNPKSLKGRPWMCAELCLDDAELFHPKFQTLNPKTLNPKPKALKP